MGLAFLAPLFLGGLALLVAPYLIHQIRRPEREVTRFSSLMFIPETRKEIIERRRIQHILLMLLRMAVLAFLALAFARPYLRSTAAVVAPAEGAAWHVVLLDTSYSMGAEGLFDAAKAKARSVVDSIGPTDRVGVIAFASTAQPLAPLVAEDDPEAGSRAAARQAIAGARTTEESTAYVPALQEAEAMLSSAENATANPPARFVVHLVSDLQRAGMPEKTSRWKLGPRVELRCEEIGEPDRSNFALTDVGVRPGGQDELRVSGKLRNWSDTEVERTVTLAVAGRENLQTALAIAPGAARQVSFRVPIEAASTLEGQLQLEDDRLPIDNRRYFAWQAAGKQRVVLFSAGDPDGGPSARRFLASALPADGDLPWLLEVQPVEQIADDFLTGAGRPSIVVIGDTRNLPAAACESIRRYVETGGGLLLALDRSAAPDTLNDELLAPWGIRSDGPLRSEADRDTFALWSWVDFDHPVFFALREPQFNDFSSLFFYNSHKLSLSTPRGNAGSDDNSRAIARFEPDDEGREWPAMVEARVGGGRAIVWAFGMDLEWSNLPRSVKFIPLLYETLGYLGGRIENRRTWTVGDRLQPPAGSGTEAAPDVVSLPGEDDAMDWDDSGEMRVARSGFVRWGTTGGAGREIVEAVNVPADESNPERIDAEEIQLKLCSPAIATGQPMPLDVERGSVIGSFVIKQEYWRWLLALLFAFLVLECWRAATVRRQI